MTAASLSAVLVPVILCGGAGTRLWPASRETFPKPFLTLPDGNTLLHKTLLRAQAMAAVAHVPEIVIVANEEIHFLLKDACVHSALKGIPLRFILEPIACNTAAAIAAAAEVVQQTQGSHALMLVLPADHLIEGHQALHTCVRAAIEAAQVDALVTFGITPTRSETGFGYMELEKTAVAGHPLAYKVLRFIEKPSHATATALIHASHTQTGNRVVWNSGMFCFKAKSILDALERHTPASAQPARQAARAALIEYQRTTMHPSAITYTEEANTLTLQAHYYKHALSISIDHAVMEYAHNLLVVPADLEWSDIGSWDAFSALIPADTQGNRIVVDKAQQGAVKMQDVANCTIQAGDRLIGAVGITDLVIVDTPDALLVSHRDRTQDVKEIVQNLKNEQHASYKLHRTVSRPWGSYTVLEEGERFKLKRLVVKPGAYLSLQSHEHRSEHWVVVNGRAQVIKGEEQSVLEANQSIYIPAGYKHRLGNEESDNLILIEVQCGDYLGEDDIVRFDDQYGRH